MSDDVYVGTVAPAACVMVVHDDDFDLAAVTGAFFSVLKPGPSGAEATWTATIAYDGASEDLTVKHDFDEGDVDTPGTYAIFAVLSTPSGSVRTKTRTFVAKKKFDTTL